MTEDECLHTTTDMSGKCTHCLMTAAEQMNNRLGTTSYEDCPDCNCERIIGKSCPNCCEHENLEVEVHEGSLFDEVIRYCPDCDQHLDRR